MREEGEEAGIMTKPWSSKEDLRDGSSIMVFGLT